MLLCFEPKNRATMMRTYFCIGRADIDDNYVGQRGQMTYCSPPLCSQLGKGRAWQGDYQHAWTRILWRPRRTSIAWCAALTLRDCLPRACNHTATGSDRNTCPPPSGKIEISITASEYSLWPQRSNNRGVVRAATLAQLRTPHAARARSCHAAEAGVVAGYYARDCPGHRRR